MKHSRPPAAPRQRPLARAGEGVPRRLTVVLAVACGTMVANLYYAQPLLHVIAASLHTGTAAAGLVITCSQVGFALGLAFVLPLGDLVDRRRLVLALVALTAVGLLAAAAAEDLAALGVAVAVVGLASVVAQVLVPLAASLATEETRGQVVGTVMTGLLLGILLARTAAGLIGQLLGWRAVYVVAAAVMLVLWALLRRELPDVAPTSTLAYPQLLASVGHLLRTEPVLRRRCLLGALVFAAFSVFWTTMAFLLSRPPYRLDDAVIGLFGLAGAAGALAAGQAGRLADRGRSGATTVAGAVVVAASFAILALGTHALAAVVVGVVTLDLGAQALHVSNQSQIYRLAPQARSRVNTAYMTSYFAGGALGSAGGAAAYGAGGWAGVCWLGGAIGAATVLAAGYTSWRAAREEPAGRAERAGLAGRQERAGAGGSAGAERPGAAGVMAVGPGAAPPRRR